VKFWISNIKFFEKKTNHSFAEFFDEISNPYNTTQKFSEFF